MFRKLLVGIFAVVLTMGVGNAAIFATPIGDETQRPAAERKFDAKTLAVAEKKTERPNFEKSSMAEYEREKAKARRMSTGKKIAIVGAITAGVIIIAAIAANRADFHTF
jgi:hypothetical protein